MIKTEIHNICKAMFLGVGGSVGWLVEEFRPVFPLMAVTMVFILYDAWTAFQLDRRVHAKYPTKKARQEIYFTSFAFGKVVKTTIPKRLWAVLMAWTAEHWVFVHVDTHLTYIMTGAILFEQAWSILENESSCRDENESRFWKMLQRIMIDKTERHFDITLDELKKDGRFTDEQLLTLRKMLEEKEKENDE